MINTSWLPGAGIHWILKKWIPLVRPKRELNSELSLPLGWKYQPQVLTSHCLNLQSVIRGPNGHNASNVVFKPIRLQRSYGMFNNGLMTTCEMQGFWFLFGLDL